MKKINLYRKRIIPDETVLLKDDAIISIENNYIITRWKTLKPREDFSRGLSLYLLDRGVKISRFFDKNDKPLFFYCDAVETAFDEDKNSYVFTDLLADVLVYDNGTIKILDLDEFAEAVEKKLITFAQAQNALTSLSFLLSKIGDGSFYDLAGVLDRV